MKRQQCSTACNAPPRDLWRQRAEEYFQQKHKAQMSTSGLLFCLSTNVFLLQLKLSLKGYRLGTWNSFFYFRAIHSTAPVLHKQAEKSCGGEEQSVRVTTVTSCISKGKKSLLLLTTIQIACTCGLRFAH